MIGRLKDDVIDSLSFHGGCQRETGDAGADDSNLHILAFTSQNAVGANRCVIKVASVVTETAPISETGGATFQRRENIPVVLIPIDATPSIRITEIFTSAGQERNMDSPDQVAGDETPILTRRSPIDRSDSGLVSRDYQPIIGGPKLICSWPLGPAPGDDFPTGPWTINHTDFVPVQRNILTAPNLAPVDYAPTYLVACGRAHVDQGATLTLRIANRYFSGKPYETEWTVQVTEPTPFLSSTVECAPDEPDYESPEARVFPEYALEAKVEGGCGYLDPGTNVQLWSE